MEIKKLNIAIGVLATKADNKKLKALFVVTSALKELTTERGELLAMLKDLSGYVGGAGEGKQHIARKAVELLKRYE